MTRLLPRIHSKHLVQGESLPEESLGGCVAGSRASPSGMVSVVVLCREEPLANTEIGPKASPAFGDPVKAAERAVRSRLGADAVGLRSTMHMTPQMTISAFLLFLPLFWAGQ